MGRTWIWVVTIGVALVILAAAMGEAAQGAVRALAATTLIGATLWRLRRDPNIDRGPWLWIVAGGVLALVSAAIRLVQESVVNGEAPFPGPAEIPGYVSYVLIITAARSFWKHRSRRREPEAGLDGSIVAAATAVVVFTSLLSDYLRDDSVALAARAGNVGYSILTITLVGHVARLAVGPGIRNTAWRLIAIATGLIVANDLLLLLDTTGSSWALWAAGVTSPVAFVSAVGAILHPDAPDLTKAPTYNPPTLSVARIALLGAALLTLPASLLSSVLRDTDPDLPVLVVGSAALAALTLGRIMMLFRSREQVGDLDRALRESGRNFIDAATPAEIAAATARTLQLVTGDEARFAAVISSGPTSRHLITRLNKSAPTSVKALAQDDPAPSLEELVGGDDADASEWAGITLELGEDSRLGSIVIDTDRQFDDAHSLALLTMSAQITEALASLELRESTYRQRAEQRLTALVEQSADIVAVVDENREIMFVSPNADRILGVNRHSLIGSDAISLVHGDDVDQVLVHIGRPTLPHEAAIITEARLATKDGDFRWFDITARDFRHDDEVGGLVITARDVTEERAAKIGLRKSERWFRGLVQNSSDVIAVVDDDGVFTYASPAVDRLLGYRPDELRGRNVLEIISEEQIAKLHGLRRELAQNRVDNRIIEVELARRDGDIRVVEVTITDLRDDPSVAGMVLNIRDVTDRKQLEQDLRHQVLHDDLTGLGSRVQFSNQLAQALGNGRRPGSNVAVLFIDVDDFKNVNDSLGHVVGDQVLVEIAGRLLGRLRLHDRAARFGGDEFAVLLTDVYGDSDVELVADRVVEELSRPITLLGQEIRLSVSVGIAIDEDGSQTPDDLLRAADVAMYQAKDAGKGRWEIFRAGMADKTMERFEISNALAAAIENDELMVYYQPIIELHSGRTAGLEALVRWSHPARGMVSPASFIPIAEQNGLILPLGRSVLRKATSQVAEWREQGHPIYVSVNISAVQLASGGIVEEVLGIVDDSGIDRSAVVLELTESALIADFSLVIDRINALRAAGIRVAIDDFGTGYSTLRYASEFAADILKIDQAFVAKLDQDDQASIVSTVLALADAMEAETVAEGIETPAQHEALLRLGCELGQGYYFYKPSPADRIEEALAGERQGHTLVGRTH